ncbi:MAG: glycoside hydrolase family 43 protein [Tannerella sp.]|jgi:hypothetical protein|nr:glycoside hydrolase family 43 protein [Tannerella sp.]
MKSKTIISVLAMLASGSLFAQNPIIQTNYTADPAPMAYNDKLYLYTSHDEDNATWFVMNDWRLYTTSDMVNWTDHGAVLSYTDFKWAKGDAWAPQCIERNGKFYMYVPMIAQNNRPAIGVAVADSPYGPFYDPLGKPLVQSEKYGDIDPTVMIDTDGQAYLYWGNPFLYYVKLNEDMISCSGEIVEVPMVIESFGKREGNVKDRPTLYEEGPWQYKRNDIYYLFWPGGPLPEHIGYSTSAHPTGPWKYGGTVMTPEGGVFTNHPGVVDFRGKTYFFYHNGNLPGGGGFNRSVCVEELKFRNDGSIPELKMTKEGIQKGLTTLNPYVKTEAETIAWSEGVKSMQNKQVGVFITARRDSSYIKVKDVDFRDKRPSKFFARMGTTHNERVTMEVRLDTIDGQLLCSIRAPRTGGNDRWEVVSADVANVKGVHDVYFVFRGRPKTDLMFFDYWRFVE